MNTPVCLINSSFFQVQVNVDLNCCNFIIMCILCNTLSATTYSLQSPGNAYAESKFWSLVRYLTKRHKSFLRLQFILVNNHPLKHQDTVWPKRKATSHSSLCFAAWNRHLLETEILYLLKVSPNDTLSGMILQRFNAFLLYIYLVNLSNPVMSFFLRSAPCKCDTDTKFH